MLKLEKQKLCPRQEDPIRLCSPQGRGSSNERANGHPPISNGPQYEGTKAPVDTVDDEEDAELPGPESNAPEPPTGSSLPQSYPRAPAVSQLLPLS